MTAPLEDEIFVFGSNLIGVHGLGAAAFARVRYGAEWGVGVGMTGKCYALPTKDQYINSMSLVLIQAYVDDFIEFAKLNPKLKFFVTRLGCGLAGNDDAEIAPMFKGAPENCDFPEEWKPFLS
jgi:hypothetical protein